MPPRMAFYIDQSTIYSRVVRYRQVQHFRSVYVSGLRNMLQINTLKLLLNTCSVSINPFTNRLLMVVLMVFMAQGQEMGPSPGPKSRGVVGGWGAAALSWP